MSNRKPCDVETIGDFTRYYSQNNRVFGIYRPSHGTTVPARYMGGGGPNGAPMVIMPMVSTGNAYVWDEVNPIKLGWDDFRTLADFGVPKVGMVEVGGELAYGSITGERNSNRGLELNRVKFYDFNHWHLRKKYGAALPVANFYNKILWQVYARSYVPIEAAWTCVVAGDAAGWPIHINFGLYSLPDSRYPLLAYKRWTVGYMPDPLSVQVYPPYEDYREYINAELFNRWKHAE